MQEVPQVHLSTSMSSHSINMIRISLVSGHIYQTETNNQKKNINEFLLESTYEKRKV